MKTNLNITDEHERSETAETLLAIKSCKRIKNNTKNFYEVCKEVKEGSQALRYKGRMIDLWSASHFVAVYEKLNEENKLKLLGIAKVNPSKAMSIVWSVIK